jgi:gas vesicle protein GvpL/GvpF
MPVHLYGVMSANALPSSSTLGLDGLPVRTLLLGERCAWVSDISASTLEATPQRLREHDAVLRDAVAAEYSVVPSLFGRLHADDASLGAALERSADLLDEAMTLVRGRVEMSFLVAPSGATGSAEDEEPRETREPGRDHLQRVRKQIHAERILRDKASELAQSASRVLGELSVAERVVESPAPPVLAARAHLVARENVARYVRAVSLQAASADPELRVAVRGPGAAYSFAAVRIG